MSESTEMSRMAELEETVKNLTRKVEALWKENVVLYQKSEKTDIWVVQLLGCCKEVVKHVKAQEEKCSAQEEKCSALEEKCSALTQELDLQNLHLDALGMSVSREEKSLNDSFLSEIFQIQAPHISGLPGSTMDEFTAAMGGALELELEHQNVPSHSMNAQLFEPIATIPAPISTTPTSRKRKAEEMAESGPGRPSAPSSSYSAPITFLNTFSDEIPAPTRRPTRNPAKKARGLKAGMLQTPPPEEPAQGQEEELQVTEEENVEAICVLFGSYGETSSSRHDDSEYDLFRPSNWVC